MLQNSDFDRLIDAALKTYGDADSGLESRVLARLNARNIPAASRRSRIMWIAVIPAAACLLLLAFLTLRMPARAPEGNAFNTPPQQHAPDAEDRHQPRMPERTIAVSHRARPKSSVPRSVVIRLPKRDVFPTPQSLSPAERALAEFAAQAPESEHKSFIEAQKQTNEPAHISAIQIVAIQIRPIELSKPATD